MNDQTSKVLHSLRDAGDDGSTVREIAHTLDGEMDAKQVRRELRSLVKTGAVARLGRDHYVAAGSEPTVEGQLVLEDGVLYVVPDDGGRVEVPAESAANAVCGDRVVARVSFDDGKRLRVGRVDSVAEPAPRQGQGRLRRFRGAWIADIEHIGEPVVLARPPEGAKAGDRVDVRVVERRKFPRGQNDFPALALSGIVADPEQTPLISARSAYRRVDGDELHATRLLDQLASGMGVDAPFPPGAIEEAEAGRAPTDVEPDRLDLTDMPLVTIDGETAKDFDDAVFAEKVGRDVHLMVAIADVSSYVEEGGELDIEARRRGCSCYLPGRVYPMLPSHLSDDICSLRPNVLRRCAWVSIMIGPKGDVTSYDAGFGVLRSHARLTYTRVQAFLDGDREGIAPVVADSLEALNEVFERLHAKRQRRGMLDLDLPEPSIQLSADGTGVTHVEPHPRLRAHRIIEECMLAANETVADFLASRGWPAILRVHNEPDPERVAEVSEVGAALGLKLAAKKIPTVDELDSLIASLGGGPRARILSFLVLRSLPRAEYAVDDAGHFGIGASRYLHFTSPIRRYPDLVVHRLLRRALAEKGPKGRDRNKLEHELAEFAKAANVGEERATKAERYADRLLRARFMYDHVGERFEGYISDVVPFGLFISIPEPFVDGLVPIAKVSDEFVAYDEDLRRLEGTKSGKTWSLGDSIEVECVAVDVSEGRVTFVPVVDGELSVDEGRSSRGRRSPKGGRGKGSNGSGRGNARRSSSSSKGGRKSGSGSSRRGR